MLLRHISHNELPSCSICTALQASAWGELAALLALTPSCVLMSVHLCCLRGLALLLGAVAGLGLTGALVSLLSWACSLGFDDRLAPGISLGWGIDRSLD